MPHFNPKSNSTFTTSDISGMIASCQSSHRLNDWENQYISDIADQWDEYQHLSAKQLEILERIYAERTS